jgi:hypothetical protein
MYRAESRTTTPRVMLRERNTSRRMAGTGMSIMKTVATVATGTSHSREVLRRGLVSVGIGILC